MAIEHFGVRDTPAIGPVVSDQEFSVTWKGYDREEVRAFLEELEAEFRELEAWADQARTRLAVARDEMIPRAEVDEAMIAIFDAKERVLDKARRRADRIEADARQRARAGQREVAAEIVLQAQIEARRIIQVAITGTTPAAEKSISDVARREADRLVVEAEVVADHWIRGAGLVADPVEAREPDQPQLDADSVETETNRRFEPTPDPGATGQRDADRQPEFTAPATEGQQSQPISQADDDGADRPSRYASRSARLPSIGDDASKILSSMDSLRLREDDA